MILSNAELQKIYWGALRFEETEDGYLQGFQYMKDQEDYFERVSDFWFERCTASTAKTLEFKTTAEKFSFDYRIIWKGSEDSVELYVDGVVTDIRYIKDMEDEGTLAFTLPAGEKTILFYLPADATMQIKNFEIAGADGRFVPAKAELRGSSIVLSNEEIEAPVAARYMWIDYAEVTLFGANRLPVAPFRTTASGSI